MNDQFNIVKNLDAQIELDNNTISNLKQLREHYRQKMKECTYHIKRLQATVAHAKQKMLQIVTTEVSEVSAKPEQTEKPREDLTWSEKARLEKNQQIAETTQEKPTQPENSET